ncbi:hypothetical protein MH117_20830 [Paenibacillus sp. ACRRX]|uniref:hypothetical protein n=1 Tax=unclassified Paenibacillus TaxID=185978 RepID=UPI001EF73FED|nr:MULTISPECIES: hypothetical protein [unclassified Paenibacillus]MCG7409857.1 hypothetical protein [Paenibacillus sp. ACRRX]MDK8183076.1 hypothetical protein [Paenibacillus sp. UMB4589-SE434]
MQHYGSQMKPLTGKELEYIVDCISNEDLLMKQSAATAASTSNPAVAQALTHMIHVHEQHMGILLNTIQQHVQLAPTQPTSSQS